MGNSTRPGNSVMKIAALRRAGWRFLPFGGGAQDIAAPNARRPRLSCMPRACSTWKAAASVSPGEVLVEGDRITAVGGSVKHPAGAEIIDLGDTTLMPGLIDAHVHLFLHPGAEDLQTVEESEVAADHPGDPGGQGRSDGRLHRRTRHGDRRRGLGRARRCATPSTRGLFPVPACASAATQSAFWAAMKTPSATIPAQHVLPNADYANSADQLIDVMRQQRKEGADFVKIYETGADSMRGGGISHALSIYRAPIESGDRRGGAPGNQCRCPCPRRTGHALCG